MGNVWTGLIHAKQRQGPTRAGASGARRRDLGVGPQRARVVAPGTWSRAHMLLAHAARRDAHGRSSAARSGCRGAHPGPPRVPPRRAPPWTPPPATPCRRPPPTCRLAGCPPQTPRSCRVVGWVVRWRTLRTLRVLRVVGEVADRGWAEGHRQSGVVHSGQQSPRCRARLSDRCMLGPGPGAARPSGPSPSSREPHLADAPPGCGPRPARCARAAASAHLTEKQSPERWEGSRTVKVNCCPFSALMGPGRSLMCTSLPSVSICTRQRRRDASLPATTSRVGNGRLADHSGGDGLGSGSSGMPTRWPDTERHAGKAQKRAAQPAQARRPVAVEHARCQPGAAHPAPR